jgi:hypothetical protein
MVSVVLTGCTTYPEWMFDDVTLRTVVAQYGSIFGVDPSVMRRGGGISHCLSLET